MKERIDQTDLTQLQHILEDEWKKLSKELSKELFQALSELIESKFEPQFQLLIRQQQEILDALGPSSKAKDENEAG